MKPINFELTITAMEIYVLEVALNPVVSPQIDFKLVDCPLFGDRHRSAVPTPYYLHREFSALPKSALKARDFVRSTYKSFLISSRAKQQFERHNLTGWKTFKVTMPRAPERAEQFHLFQVIDFLGPFSQAAGLQLVKEACPGCGLGRSYTIGHPERMIDPAVSNGHDFFMLWPLVGYLFVSGRAKNACEELPLVGASFKTIAQTFPSGRGQEFGSWRDINEAIDEPLADRYRKQFPDLPLAWGLRPSL